MGVEKEFPFWLYVGFQDLNVALYLNTPINPGEPIKFRLTSWPLKLRSLDLGTISFSLHLVDEFGNVDPAATLYQDALSASDSQKIVRDSFSSPQLSAVPPPDLEKRVTE